MWALRILTGPQAGTSIPLKSGRNIVGRAPHCDIKLQSAGVSKEHTDITVYADKMIVTDLKSSNGTYLNGVKIQNSTLSLGDKLAVHDVILDVIPYQDKKTSRTQATISPMGMQNLPSTAPAPQQVGQVMSHGYGMPSQTMGANAYAQMPMGDHSQVGQAGMPQAAPAYSGSFYQVMQEKISDYLDRVALPGVYKLAQLLEFKQVLLMFVALFILSTTLLSMFPMVQITRTSILIESKRRAGSIARTVATLNQSALLQNSYSSLSLNAAESEEGVKQVLIVQQSDGMILAPASRAGTTPDLPFVHAARREMRPQAVEVDSSTIGVSFPIGLFDPNTGEQSVKAHVIVLYDVGALAFDDGQAISLFMQTIVMASVLGLILFFFMYKLIEYPIVKLNGELDTAMRDKKDSTRVDFNFPALQNLIGNVNSLLTRSASGGGGADGSVGFVSKESEAENIVRIVGYPCVAIGKDSRIIAANDSFLQVAHAEGRVLNGKPVSEIPDGSLQQNLYDLTSRAEQTPVLTHTDQLEFGGHPCILSCQAVCVGNQPEYYLVTVSPAEGGS